MNNSHAPLQRRGFNLGEINLRQAQNSDWQDLDRWHSGQAVLLKELFVDAVGNYQEELRQAERLYLAILDEQECDLLLDQAPYSERLANEFDSLGCSVNAGDNQEIETVMFDALDNGEVVAEDLWVKVSWLSFYEEDASLRFRFSFGVDHVEDVAADQQRQYYAANLTDKVFPESRLISQSEELAKQLSQLLNHNNLLEKDVRYVERIVYFNAPNGGAYLHHDRERGHAGVVYAQLSGATFWLALPRQTLVKEVANFITECQTTNQWPSTITTDMQTQLASLDGQAQAIVQQLETFAHSALIHLINETEAFVQHLISRGHGQLVQTGDALLLPQTSDDSCCWHSVFNIGDQSGQALSFAIRSS